jgi:hypothetical protein
MNISRNNNYKNKFYKYKQKMNSFMIGGAMTTGIVFYSTGGEYKFKERDVYNRESDGFASFIIWNI